MNQDDIVIEVTKIANSPIPSEHAEYYLRIWKVFGLAKKYGEVSKFNELKEEGRLIIAVDQ